MVPLIAIKRNVMATQLSRLEGELGKIRARNTLLESKVAVLEKDLWEMRTWIEIDLEFLFREMATKATAGVTP